MKSKEPLIKTVALRFSDNFAPDEGTISVHRNLIKENGYVWYGKLGAAVSNKVIAEIMDNEAPRILLIHSGKSNRYWAFIDRVQHEAPKKSEIPEYYRDIAGKFNTWFRVTDISDAENNVMSKCIVVSSGDTLSNVSKHSMSPYFIINFQQDA
ncbi:hypothetical protein [Mediterraneibacter massiliensis]|jgi:hypothetical protein|uniref:hypothetical protein n=1 Tax=Mediterraneibacter massiliensis TaxID=1720300 RepID=UPI0024AD733D|nr:hypothetical protein [Mediterraneibacter massiliensis]